MKKLILPISFYFLFFIPLFIFPDSNHQIDTLNNGKGVYPGYLNEEQITPSDELINHPINFSPLLRINERSDFRSVKANNMVAFLVGNNDYQSDSGFSKLMQCENDVILLSRILNVCCKVDFQNIHTNFNITVKEFISRLDLIVKNLDKSQGIFISFSGHGDRDGSLVFTDGSMMKSEELKELINSFPNDTILLIDACHSGSNDVSFNLKDNTSFKSNSIRIYSSLAHMNSKEILYNSNNFFMQFKDFYKNVLDLPEMTGNGYFTAFVGGFFAEFDFSNNENISYQDLMIYISNKNNQYVEDLAKSRYRSKTIEEEYNKRQYQIPKIYPLGKKNQLNDPNHQFLIINQPVQIPLGFLLKFSFGPSLTLPGLLGTNWGAGLSLDYYYFIEKTNHFFIGMESGYLFFYREKTNTGLNSILANFIPIIAKTGFQKIAAPFNDTISIDSACGGGICIGIWNQIDIRESSYFIHGFFSGELNFTFLLSNNLNFNIGVHAYDIILTIDSHIFGLTLPLSFSYQF